ncbi:Gfo/Idh/MocA family protein [Enterovirga aerilata]|uniref:Gfo/Idh/MocA family oxidoreductase n=1 Tax=Enterovirga aerilata TaxID=2730920 RepID=A0A849I414_9HYPH|nr:Gfo/Idh/MocA family oxidoreductase [Enterovirga sp. DB1703]NNM70880.1 Gfo/Idh/MocA family oxidoreductase [Enterovirga sp. DB1703]
MTVRKPVGIAVVGCGRIVHAHADAIAQQPDVARLVAFVDTDLALAQNMAARYGAPHAFGSVAEALAHPEIEAVDLCLPIEAHGPVTIECLRGGRHVIVEKPMAQDAATAYAMNAAAKAAGRVLVVGQSRRHSSAVGYVRDNLASFGRLRSLQAAFCMYWDGPQVPWWAERTPEEGLVIPQLGSHALDFVQLIMGERPTTVYCQTHRWRDCWKAEDEVMMLLTYPSGRLATALLSYNQRPFFERHFLLFDDCFVEVRDSKTVLVDDRVVLAPPEDDPDGELITNELFKNQLRDFVLAIEGRPSRSAFAPETAQQIEILDAALASSLSGQPVQLGPLPA